MNKKNHKFNFNNINNNNKLIVKYNYDCDSYYVDEDDEDDGNVSTWNEDDMMSEDKEMMKHGNGKYGKPSRDRAGVGL